MPESTETGHKVCDILALVKAGQVEDACAGFIAAQSQVLSQLCGDPQSEFLQSMA